MHKGILHTHYLVVTLFLLIYVVKTVLLLSNKTDVLAKFTKKFKVPEMIISLLFLATGIYLMLNLPFGGKYDYLFWIKLAMVFASIPVAVIGFKKHNKILAALSLLLITGAFGLAEVYSKKKGIAKDDGTQMAGTEGQILYKKNCAICHGDDGKLGLAGAKDLSATAMEVTQIKEIILNGKGDMAPVSVSEAEAATIAEYVQVNIKGH